MLKGNFRINDFKNVLYSLNKRNILLTIGSILSSHNKKSSLIWGSGLMYEDAIIHKANFYSVRGKYSQNRLKALGYQVPSVIGDPALLLSLIIKPSVKIYRLGIIPHYLHYAEIKKKINSQEVLVINLQDDIEIVVEQITTCQATISSSLHGLIVSHTYYIPSLWFNLADNKLAGDNVKFKDYFSSVGIEEYFPFKIDLDSFNLDEIKEIITDNCKINSIQNDLNLIQSNLINSAPFFIMPKYKI